jgi:hypothetical protein
MLINKQNGIVCCPFCQSEDPDIEYECQTEGREWGTYNGDYDYVDSETTNSYDYDYHMSCCNREVYHNEADDIIEGRFEITEEDGDWDDDECEDENNSIQDPVKALFKHLTK